MRQFTIVVVALVILRVLSVAAAPHALAKAAASSWRSTRPAPQSNVPAPRVQAAADGVLDLFKQKSVVAIADAHGLAQEEDFYSALVRDPRFAKEVGNVVVEFGGSSAQIIIDRYENGGDVSLTELRRVWTDVAGWLPGSFGLGYVNFFANVRAANLNLAANDRINVWLGDPSIDWTNIHSFQDLEPYLSQRDENMFRVISSEILKKHKKALLIVGSAHLFGPGSLAARIDQVYPNSMAIVAPFTGYIETDCNARFVAYAKDWPLPAVAGPVGDTSLKSELQLPGCNYVPKSEIQRIEKMLSTPPPPGTKLPPGMSAPPSAAALISAESNMASGASADELLYLGRPGDLLQAPIDPNIYLDPEYFKEMNRRAQCCTPTHYSLDWDQFVQQNSAIPRTFQAH